MIRNQNRKFVLAARPQGMPSEECFRLVEEPLPEPGPGEALIRARYLSLDPYMRGRMSDAPSYVKGVDIGEVMTGGVVGEVIRSETPELATGDIVEGLLGWQEYAVAKPKAVRKIDPDLAPISTALGVLGMPGVTAYFGLLDVGRLKVGETVFVSAASGAVGSVVGQIAKIEGCRAAGSVGSDAKVAYVTKELGFDAALNYRTAHDLDAAVAEACPEGIDVYFDNVGGAITDAVLGHINIGARVVICGQISQYNLTEPELVPRNLRLFLVKRARLQGFLVFDYADRYPEALAALAGWIKAGKLKYHEDVIEGFENMPAAFLRLFTGGNLGKQLVKARDAA